MTPALPRYDRLARSYHAWEWLAFGPSLQRARCCLLDRLERGGRILMLGEGSGRALARILRTDPGARIDCIDGSAAMLARAAARLRPAERERVRWLQADIRRVELPSACYDAVTTLFFLDCLTEAEARALVPRIAASLRPGGRWLWADFAEPEGRWARGRARVWLRVLYTFFRWRTGQRADRLPPAEALIAAEGFAPVATLTFQGGLLRSVVFSRHLTPAIASTNS